SDQIRHNPGGVDPSTGPRGRHGPPDPPDPTSASSEAHLATFSQSPPEPPSESSQDIREDNSVNSKDPDQMEDSSDEEYVDSQSSGSSMEESSSDGSNSDSNNLEGAGVLSDKTHGPAHNENTLGTKKMTYANATNPKTQKQYKTNKTQKKNQTDDEVEEFVREVEEEMRKEVDFLYKGVKDTMQGPGSVFQRISLDKLMGSMKPEMRLRVLNKYFENKNSLKMKLENPNELSKETIITILQEWCAARLEKEKTIFQTVSRTIRNTEEKLEELMERAANEMSPTKEIVVEKTRLTAILNDSLSAVEEQFKLMGALMLIPTARIVDNRIHFPMSRQPNTAAELREEFDLHEDIHVSADAINDAMAQILRDTDFSSERVDTDWFYVKDAPRVKGQLMVLNVGFDPFGLIRQFVTRCFLQPEDSILAWYDDEERSTPTRAFSKVLVDLGQSQTPPKRLTWGVFASNHASRCQKFEKRARTLKQSDAEFVETYKEVDPEAISQLQSLTDDLHQRRVEVIKAQKETSLELMQTPAHAKVVDKHNVTVEVIYIFRLCPICHTTEHSYNECMKKGCKVCGHPYHPDYSCSKRCNCNKRPFHKVENCPNKSRKIAQPKAAAAAPQKATIGSQKGPYKQSNMFDILATQGDDESPEVMDTEEDEDLVEARSKVVDTRHKYQKVMKSRDTVERQSLVFEKSVQAATQPNSNKEPREDSPERARKSTSQPTRLGSILKGDNNNRVSKSVQEGQSSSKTTSADVQKLASLSSKANEGQGASGEVGPASNAPVSVASGPVLGTTAVAEKPRGPPDKGQTRPEHDSGRSPSDILSQQGGKGPIPDPSSAQSSKISANSHISELGSSHFDKSDTSASTNHSVAHLDSSGKRLSESSSGDTVSSRK
ncbi:hypothetical protein OXX69_012022, partial [Metschnikowia pulcherrima]